MADQMHRNGPVNVVQQGTGRPVDPIANAKVAPAEFCRRMIPLLAAEATAKAAKNGKSFDSKAVHTVFGGFNAAWRSYYGEQSDPVSGTKQLSEQGVVVITPAKRGAMLWLAADYANRPKATAKATDDRMAARFASAGL